MKKITFIGAGSLDFTKEIVRDIFTFPLLQNVEICLMDINSSRLEYARKLTTTLTERMNVPAKVTATMNRNTALKNADFVICTILAGAINVWRHDIEIPKKYGVDINVGDTRGPAGIFRGLRTIPVMLELCRDMEKLCPNAVLLNYTNPMAMVCSAMQKHTSITNTGLCHSVQGTAKMLAEWMGLKLEDIDYKCAGLNHQAWYLKFEKDGKDLYPEIKKLMKKKKIYNEEIVRNEMFLQLDYYVTESSGHSSEYNWWFRKRKDLIKKYCDSGTGWNPGEYAYILKEFLRRKSEWQKETKQWFKDGAPMSLEKGLEYAANLINALAGGEAFEFNGNVLNKSIITNLPENSCVEVPVLASRKGFQPIHVGALPTHLAAINHINACSEDMAVEAAMTGDPELVFKACMIDPLTASVLSLAEIKKMVAEMLKKNKDYLPQFKSVNL